MATFPEFEVEKQESGLRLDVFLCRRRPDMSRAKAKKLTADGRVRVDGRRARKGTRVETGQTVQLEALPTPSDFAASPAGPEDGTLNVVFENADLVVVNKPPGMPCHPLRPEESGTLANLLVARYPSMAGVGYKRREPGLLHRIDNNTSGLVMAARHGEAFESLREELRAGLFDKRYVALCEGTVRTPQLIDLPLAHDSDKRRVRGCFDERELARRKAKPAWTEVLSCEPVGPDGCWSLIEVRAASARRHQVRAHLAAFGHPLLGDTLYGGRAILPQTGGYPAARHRLHASFIGLATRQLKIRCEPPEDFTLFDLALVLKNADGET